jgi:predicted RNA binding protein YcfA (HicA-like mRNA interferase family)
MPKRYPPLTPDEVISILQVRGFSLARQRGSHAQYTGEWGGKHRVVTVDTAVREYGAYKLKSMISQSGMTREEFYSSTDRTAKKINIRL